MRYIAYDRVSTQKQGRSGLGLDDQRRMVQRFLRDDDERVVEFTETAARRLSRNASFVMVLRNSEVDFRACDLPDANTLTMGIMASFARHEAEQISKRTRAALAQTKARGFILGKPENFTHSHRTQGVVVIQENARVHPANRQAGDGRALE